MDPLSSGFTGECRGLADVKRLLGIEKSKELDQLGHHSCPSRLVACAQARTVVPMEVLVEENVIPPVGVRLGLFRAAAHRPLAASLLTEGGVTDW